MVTASDYRLSVSRAQQRANKIERELYSTPATELRALIADIQGDCLAITKACPLHNMTAAYREIMQDVAAGLYNADNAAIAAIACGYRFIRR
jgi:hypothetical protein